MAATIEKTEKTETTETTATQTAYISTKEFILNQTHIEDGGDIDATYLDEKTINLLLNIGYIAVK